MPAPPLHVLFTARSLLLDEATWLSGGGLLVDGGRVVEVCADAAAVRARAEAEDVVLEDLGDGVLAAGTVNAHSHLELHALRGEVPSGAGFGAWVQGVLAARAAAGPERLSAGIVEGAARLLATGTTAVGDIDSTGLAASALTTSDMRVVLYREALDAGDPDRTCAALDTAAAALEAGRPWPRTGLSPHAPFTVSPELLAGLGRLARRHACPVTIHWSETEAEVEWLMTGGGPLAALLGAAPRRRGLDLIEAAGLLGPRTSLVHGNYPDAGEAERIAAASSTVIHCPGSHAFFGREPFPLDAYRAAGVSLALGTDSSASNDDLDMRREMLLLRGSFPELSPAEVWCAATRGGAGALGLGGDIGTLAVGRCADFVLYASDASSLVDGLDNLTAGTPTVLGVWVGGRRLI